MDRVHEEPSIMIEKLLESANEISVSETENIPSFFESLPETSEINDEPISKTETNMDQPIHVITRNESLEGDVHPITGVPFERQVVEVPNGEVIEGVFPEFESNFNVTIPNELYEESDRQQFKYCNEELKDAVNSDSKFRSEFSDMQLEQIQDGLVPDGYVWHHDASPGKLQLVDFETHATTGHTGGRSIWGGGNEKR